MPDWLINIPPDLIKNVMRVFVLVVLGVPLTFAISRWLRGYVLKRYTAQYALIASRLVLYGVLALIALSIARQFGIELGPLMGAAGIFGIAIGFASQTSVSNVISGLFLLAEEPFVIGDVITVGDTTGAVLSIDLISVKIRTFDNKLVRIPNETLVKSQLTNITHFPIRRVDIEIGVAYREDIQRVTDVLIEEAKREPLCLMEPAPLVIFQGFKDSSMNFLLAAWAEKSNWLAVKNSLSIAIKRRFDAEEIEIPFPHLTLYAGSETKPFPVKMERKKKEAGGVDDMD